MTPNGARSNEVDQPLQRLKPLRYLCEVLPDTNYQKAARMAREHILPVGVIVRLGRQIYVNPEALQEFIDRGGAAFPGGWRREAK